jgi:hypothetical protein
MLFSNACCFALLSLLSLSANAEYVRGDHTPIHKKGSLFRRDLFMKGGDDNPSSRGKEDEVELLSAGNYVILAKTGISTVSPSVITGDIAVSPAAATTMTGFDSTTDSTGTFSTSAQITGKAYAADYAEPTPTDLNTAVSAMETAYTDADGRDAGVGARLNLGAGTLGGSGKPGGANDPLTPGVYTFNTGVEIAGNIYFEGSGSGEDEGKTDVFIIQMTRNLKQVANTKVILQNGALAKNIFWQVPGEVTVEAGAHMEGILLVKTAALFVTGSSLKGRVLAQTACDLQKATITQT